MRRTRVRRLSLALTVEILLSLAGCAGQLPVDGGDPVATTTATDAPASDAVGSVVVWNNADERWDVRAVLERDGQVVVDRNQTLAPDEKWHVTNVTRSGPFTVRFSFADGRTLSETVDPAGTTEVSVRVQVFGDDDSPSVRVYRTVATETRTER